MEKFKKIVDDADSLITFICIILLCVLTLMVFASVVLRVCFSISFQFMEELCRYTFIAFIMLMCGPVIWRETHINVDIVLKKLKGRPRKVLEILNTIMTLAVLIYIVGWSVPWISNIKRFGQLTSSQKFQLWKPNMLVPIGLGLAVLFAAALLIRQILEFKKEEDPKKDELDLDSII